MKKIFTIAAVVMFSVSASAQTTLKQELEAESTDPFYDEFYDINGDQDKVDIREYRKELTKDVAPPASPQKKEGPISYGDGPISSGDGPLSGSQ